MTTQNRLDLLYTAFNEALPGDRVKVLAGVAGVLFARRPPRAGGRDLN